MSNAKVPRESFSFLQRLGENNNREWFTEHKKEFKAIETSVKDFYNTLLEKMKMHDEIEKLKMFRIYRDVRFSQDKTPYKTHFAGSFSRAGEHRRGGYYLRLKPGETFIAAGFWEPNKEDLLRIRKELERDATEFRETITAPGLRGKWGSIEGEELKTAPKGFDREHPDIDLIRKKQFIFVRKFSDKEVMAPGFIDEANDSFKAIRPYFELMSDILTTDLNGESLLK